MSNSNQNENNIGHAYKCGGIPVYPLKHDFYKRLEGVSEEYIKNR